MKRISLVYFSGCPNYEPVRQILKEINLPFKEINQDNLHEGCFGKNFSSPTILVDDDIVIFGGKTNSSGNTCSINIPDKQELESLLKGLV